MPTEGPLHPRTSTAWHSPLTWTWLRCSLLLALSWLLWFESVLDVEAQPWTGTHTTATALSSADGAARGMKSHPPAKAKGQPRHSRAPAGSSKPERQLLSCDELGGTGDLPRESIQRGKVTACGRRTAAPGEHEVVQGRGQQEICFPVEPQNQ